VALATFAAVELEVCEQVALPGLGVVQAGVSLEMVSTEALSSSSLLREAAGISSSDF
jgi:hypothetical protein